MSRKIVFLINPISGGRNKAKLKTLIEKRLSNAPIPYCIMPTDVHGEYAEVSEIIKNEHYNCVVICGGDGSVNQAVKALRNHPVQFGIIPMGSGNGLAFAAGIPSSPIKAIEVILNGNAFDTDAFWLNEHFGCMLSGVGFDAIIAHDFSKQKKRGLSAYLKRCLYHFFKSGTFSFSFEINNHTFTENCYFISVANSNQFGNHVTIAPKASLNDGMLDVVVVKKMNKIRLLAEIAWQIKMGKVTVPNTRKNNSAILYFQSNYITINNPQKAPVHIDGEPAGNIEKLSIQIIPSAFKLIQPTSF
ncbi:MAG: YegS/Rv2252/BmrU family lipid kinase [Ferruginibacter sp.]|nr:YegS/Rv2252/BmrU family lipid kinase [Ferruginibacter sp.]